MYHVPSISDISLAEILRTGKDMLSLNMLMYFHEGVFQVFILQIFLLKNWYGSLVLPN